MQSGKTPGVFHTCLGATYGISIDCIIYLMLNLMASLQCLVFLHAYFQTFSSSTWASHHLALWEAELLRLSARQGESEWCWFCCMWPIILTFMIDQAVVGPGSQISPHLHLLPGRAAYCSPVNLWSYISLPSKAHLETLWLASLIPKNWLALL